MLRARQAQTDLIASASTVLVPPTPRSLHQPFSGRQGEEGAKCKASALGSLTAAHSLPQHPASVFYLFYVAPEDTEGEGWGWEFRNQREVSDCGSAPFLLRSPFSPIKHKVFHMKGEF